MAEHAAVNRRVVGSSPTRGALSTFKPRLCEASGALCLNEGEIMSEEQYYVYILYSESGDRYYKGMSQNPERRLDFHNTRERGYTSRYRPWKLVYTKGFQSKTDALAAERKVKGWRNRVMIERLIAGDIEL